MPRYSILYGKLRTTLNFNDEDGGSKEKLRYCGAGVTAAGEADNSDDEGEPEGGN